MNTIKPGWIGLGTMGAPMSQRLLDAGFPVTVYNRTREKESALRTAGAAIAATPAALAMECEIVLIMVSDDAATREIFTGKNGLLACGGAGKIFINMSTVSPGISRDLAAVCQKQGNEYIDAPVSGSVKQAKEGQLVILVGGSPKSYERAVPILRHLGKLVVHLGDTGSGNTAKLAINLLLSIHTQGLAEATLFANRHGIKTEDFMHIMNNGAMGNAFSKIKGEAIIADNYKPAFMLKHMVKDLGLARDEGWDTPIAELAYQSFLQAETRFGEEDLIAIRKSLE